MIIFLLTIVYSFLINEVIKLAKDKDITERKVYIISILFTPIIGLFFVNKSRKLSIRELQNRSITDLNKNSSDKFNFKITETVRLFLTINIIMFIFELILIVSGDITYLNTIILTSNISQNYQFITYQFLHSGISHLFNNMLILILFGPTVERFYGKLKFIIFYLSFGFFGALIEILLSIEPLNIVGASASIFGIVTLFTLVDKSYFYFGVSRLFRISFFTLFLILSEIVETIKFNNDNIGHFAHLGGVIFATLFYIINNTYDKKIK